MRRLLRILLGLTTLVSLLLLIATAAVWIRGYSVRDEAVIFAWGLHGHPRYKGVTAGHSARLIHYRGSTQIIHVPDTCVGGKNRQPLDRCELKTESAAQVAAQGTPPSVLDATLGFRRKELKYRTEWLIPDYAVTLPFAILPLASLVARSSGKRQVANGLCPTCGYDLRASPNRCPECGSARPAITGGSIPLPAC